VKKKLDFNFKKGVTTMQNEETKKLLEEHTKIFTKLVTEGADINDVNRLCELESELTRREELKK